MAPDPLVALPFVERVFRFDELDSTNTFAKGLSERPSRGIYVVTARRQRAGRGQRGNSFFSDTVTGLWVSLVAPLGSLDEHFRVNRALALAACQSADAVAGVTCGIKWPNDICLAGRKLGGILLESASVGAPCVVAGLGMNVNTTPRQFPPLLRRSAISLRMATRRTYAVDTLLVSLLQAFDRLSNLAAPEAHRLYEARLVGAGRKAVIGRDRGLFEGVGEDGRARLLCGGERRYFTSGPLRFAAGYAPGDHGRSRTHVRG